MKTSINPRNFEGALEALIRHVERRSYSASLVSQLTQSVSRFFEYVKAQGVSDLRLVKDEHVTAYAKDLAAAVSTRGEPYAVATQRWHLQAVKRLFAHLMNEGVLLQDPALELNLPHWTKLPRARLNQEQARRLVAHPSPFTARGKRSRAVLELLYGTGIRVSECERLDLRDLDLASGELFIRDGKGKKDRVVPVVGRAAHAMDIYVREVRPDLMRSPREAALFLTRTGERLRVKAIQYLVRMRARAAEIPQPVSPHLLRHGCATHLLQGGADVRHVQKLLGHQSLDTTAIYTKVTVQDLAKAVEKAHPREKRWKRKRAQRGSR